VFERKVFKPRLKTAARAHSVQVGWQRVEEERHRETLSHVLYVSILEASRSADRDATSVTTVSSLARNRQVFIDYRFTHNKTQFVIDTLGDRQPECWRHVVAWTLTVGNSQQWRPEDRHAAQQYNSEVARTRVQRPAWWWRRDPCTAVDGPVAADADGRSRLDCL